jgi:uncharacterized protein (TIGR03435 family)
MIESQRTVRDEQWRERVRKLPVDRFGRVIHEETKEAQICHRIVAKGGSKMTEN